MYLLLQEAGGIMSLADVYCRFNRARGMEVRLYVLVDCSVLEMGLVCSWSLLMMFPVLVGYLSIYSCQ